VGRAIITRVETAPAEVVTGRAVFWLIHLQLESGEGSWFEYVKLNIRPR
jgi:hypothetical protein